LPNSALNIFVPVKSAPVFTCNQYFVAPVAALHLKIITSPGDNNDGGLGGALVVKEAVLSAQSSPAEFWA
jgi:hypothetical protein